MPIAYWIEKDKCRVRAEVSGSIIARDIVDTIHGALTHPDYKPGFNILSDHTKIDEVITTTQVLQTSANLHEFSKYVVGSKWAVVVSKKASFGMMNMLSVYLESVPMQLRAFYSFNEAEEWLAGRGKE